MFDELLVQTVTPTSVAERVDHNLDGQWDLIDLGTQSQIRVGSVWYDLVGMGKTYVVKTPEGIFNPVFDGTSYRLDKIKDRTKKSTVP